MPKTEVYSWRVSAETKQELERAARRENLSLGSLLERIVNRWLEAATNRDDDAQQRRLHAAAAASIGALHGGDPHRSERARETIRARLANRHARSRPD